MLVVLTGVRGRGVAVVLMEKAVEGFISAQLSGCLKIQSLFPGMHLRTGTGDGWGLGVMWTRTRGIWAKEGLGGIVVIATVVKKLVAREVFSRRGAELHGAPSPQGDLSRHGAQWRALQLGQSWPLRPPGVLNWTRCVTLSVQATGKE